MPTADCQDPKFDSLSRVGESKMNEAAYAYFLQSAIHCDKAMDILKKQPQPEGLGITILKDVAIVLLVVLAVVVGGAAGAGQGGGDPSPSGN